MWKSSSIVVYDCYILFFVSSYPHPSKVSRSISCSAAKFCHRCFIVLALSLDMTEVEIYCKF